MIFDTHAHYDDPQFDPDREALLGQMEAGGVGTIVNASASVESWERVLELTRKYPFVYGMIGVHPDEVGGLDEEVFARMKRLLKDEKLVAVGEIGLDYYWAENPSKEFQREIFRRQLALAREAKLPAIVHDREAHGGSLSIVREFPEVTGVFHCFSGSPEMAAELVGRGWYLGLDGPVTYKNAKRAPEVVAAIPLDRIVIETDAPYLSPVPHRGKRNDSRNLSYIIEKLAEWTGISPEEMARITWENGLRLFPRIRETYREVGK